MIINNICSPAIIYLGFSITQIIIDIYKMMYNTAFLKFLVSIIFTIILNILCERGLNIISWIIVFIPFIFMTVITSILLVMFGLDPFFGKLNYNIQDFDNDGNTITQQQNLNPRDVIINSNLNDNINQNNLNSISNELNNPIIPSSNIQNNIINNENKNEANLPINRILDSNKKANKSNQYTELNNDNNQLDNNQLDNNQLNNNRNTQANKNQNTNSNFLINNKSNNSNLNDCFKSCLDHCSKKNNSNDSNYCSYTCKNICNNIDYKTI